MEKTNKVLLLSSIVLVGFVITAVYHYIFGCYLDKPYPFNTFLWPADSAFGDFFDTLPLIKDLNPFKAIEPYLNYFPLAYVVLFPFALIKNKIVAYLLFISVFLGVFIWMNIKNFSSDKLSKLQNFQNVFILTALSYPFIMILDRGNFDIFLFVAFVLFVYSFKSEKYLLSAVALAVINAIKPFALVFLLLFLFKKKYRYVFISVLLSVALVLGGFMMLKGGLIKQLSTLIANVSICTKYYIYDNQNPFGMRCGSSLYMAMKLLFTRLSVSTLALTPLLVKVYNYLSVIITLITVYFAYREKIFWKQMSLLFLYMLLIPYLTNDYKLIFLFVPIWLFVNAKEKTRFDLAYTILFALLLVAKNVVIAYKLGGSDLWFSLSLIINPLIMIIFMGLIIYDQITSAQRELKNEY